MSKKEEEKKIDEKEVKEESEKDSKSNDKDNPKKSSKKTSKKKEDAKKESKKVIEGNPQLRTLIDLVEESGINRKDIIVRLANSGYLKQFYDEEEKRAIGYPIEPTINEIKFKKIIGE